MRRGLVFGKFMPLHRGHQLLIDTALSQVDDLTIVAYDSQPGGRYPTMPIDKRLDWLRELYPDVEGIVGVEDPEWDNPARDDPKYATEYAAAIEFLGRFDRVFTSEVGYERFARELGAEHVVVDQARTLVPISGSQIRENLYEHRGWVDPRVYSSLIQKVVMVGTESTGKTTLARELARVYRTLWTHEFGRELWVSQGGGTFADHLLTARRQLQRETAAARHARDFLFCDTNAWTTLHWSLYTYGAADARLVELADQTFDDYVWVVCGMDIPFEDDGVRELHGDKARRMHEQQVADLERRGAKALVYAEGSVEERVAQVMEVIGAPAQPRSYTS